MGNAHGPGSDGGHYFAAEPQAPSARRRIDVRIGTARLTFVVDRQVFSGSRLDPGTELLLGSLGDVKGAAVLDMGCGWGAIGLTCLRLGAASAVMVDVNARALELAGETAALWDVTPDLRQGDGFRALHPRERFDLIATNPPVRAGKGVYYAWVGEAARHLRRGGRFVAVIRVRQGAASFAGEMRSHFRQVRTIARRAGYHVLEAAEPRAVLESSS